MNHKLSYKIQNYRAQRVLLNTAYILGTLGLSFVQGDQVLDSPMLTGNENRFVAILRSTAMN